MKAVILKIIDYRCLNSSSTYVHNSNNKNKMYGDNETKKS